MNDLEAGGWALKNFDPNFYEDIQVGDSEKSSVSALIAVGTGMGETIISGNDKKTNVLRSEAGHADFSPHPDDSVFFKFLNFNIDIFMDDFRV